METTAEIKTRPIIMSAESVRAILEGRKTQTRRVVRPQPELLYYLTDDNLLVHHSNESSWRCINDQPCERHQTKTDPDLSQRRLYGGIGRKDLFANAIQGLREEGIRGLVSIAGAHKKKTGIFHGFLVPQQHQSNEVCASLGLHGLSRKAYPIHSSDETPGRRSPKQRAGKSGVGHSVRQLAGPEATRTGVRGRKTSDVETIKQGAFTPEVGYQERAMLAETRGGHLGDVAICHFRDLPFRVGAQLWVREAIWMSPARGNTTAAYVATPNRYRTKWTPTGQLEHAWIGSRESTEDEARAGFEEENNGWIKRPSIHMPRWASRLTLEIVSVKVERVQSITGEDAVAEGIRREWFDDGAAVLEFSALWDRVNARRGYGWDANPFVWCVTFKPVEP